MGSIPGWKNPLGEGMAIHSSILAWRFSRTEEPGGLPKGQKELATTEVTQHAACTFPQTPKIMDVDKQCGHVLILICLCFLWETARGGVALVCDKMRFGYPYIHTNGIT